MRHLLQENGSRSNLHSYVRTSCMVAGLMFAISSAASAAVTYNATDRYNDVGYTANADGWLAQGTEDPANADWTFQSFNDGSVPTRYIGYESGLSGAIYRPNDSAFSYAINDQAQQVTLTIKARVHNQSTHIFGAGLRESGPNGAERIGIGIDTDLHYYVSNASGTQTASTAKSTVHNIYRTFKLVIDTAANGGDGAGDLFIDDVKRVADVNMGLLSYNLSDLSALFVSETGYAAGPSTFTIDSVIPSPSAGLLALSGLAMLGLWNPRALRAKKQPEALNG